MEERSSDEKMRVSPSRYGATLPMWNRVGSRPTTLSMSKWYSSVLVPLLINGIVVAFHDFRRGGHRSMGVTNPPSMFDFLSGKTRRVFQYEKPGISTHYNLRWGSQPSFTTIRVSTCGLGVTVRKDWQFWSWGQTVKISACHAVWSGFNSRQDRQNSVRVVPHCAAIE